MAVRTVDLERRRDVELVRDGEPYQSAMIVGLRNGVPLGVTFVDLDGSHKVTREQLCDLFELEAGPAAESLALLGDPPDVSVVVTTCSNLGVVDSVGSILGCSPSPRELVVVENRPDHSPIRQALEHRFGDDNRVRYVEEARPGLGAARNAGLQVATSEVVAFTDDDVEVDHRWIGSISQAFAAEPDAGCVTGLILPGDLLTREQISFEQFASFAKGFQRQVYRLSEPTSSMFPFAAGEFGSGASTALRTSVARSVDGFDSALGSGTPARGAEDLDIYIRVLLAGYAVVYEPAAILRHEHPDGAQELRRKVFDYGLSLSAMLTKYAVSGYAAPLLLRSPAGLRHLTSPESRKNVNKDPNYARSLDWIERMGMVTGPVAYGLSRWRQRRAGYAPTGEPLRGGVPISVGEFDPAVPSQGIEPRLQPGGIPYERARLLARTGEVPIGFVNIALTDGAAVGAVVDFEATRQLPPGSTDVSALGVVTSRPKPDVTVVVCTRDRPESLRVTLASVLAIVGFDRLETLVVDNGPDATHTRSVIDEFAEARVRHVREPLPGLSRARNRGVAEARGEIVAFTDDDVIVDPGWLRAIVRGFSRSDRVACVTGLIVPAELDTPAEAYFDRVVSGSLHFTPRMFELGGYREADPLFPYRARDFGGGANFAVTRAMAAELGGFDEALGAGSPARGGEDLDFFVRVILAGAALAYEPSALVWHLRRSGLDGLPDQLFSYRSGLSAYSFKHLLSRRGRRVLLDAAPDLRTGTGFASAPRPLAPLIPGALRAEVIGLANGPGAYLCGRLLERRFQRSADLGRQ